MFVCYRDKRVGDAFRCSAIDRTALGMKRLFPGFKVQIGFVQGQCQFQSTAPKSAM